MNVRKRAAAGVLAGVTLTLGLPAITTTVAAAAPAAAPAAASAASADSAQEAAIAAALAQPKPGHTAIVPDKPRANWPLISTGEIWDIEVVGNRVFVAGGFTSLRNQTGNTAVVNQRYLAAFNLQTGLVDTTFRPTFNGGVSAVEASPDGTKLFVGGTFNTVNGVAMQKVASLNLTTGAPIAAFAFNKNTNNQVTALEATNTTVYVGGKFSRVNGVLKTGLAAANATTGVVDPAFSNDISGGIGPNGSLTVQDLQLTHDDSKLLVIHTGRKVAGQDRLSMAWINTATKQLLPWRSRLWDDNLGRVGGVNRIYSADISPDDQYFVVSSGSGGDAPPISDTVVAYPVAGNDFVEPRWIHRAFDSIYSLAYTEQGIYMGGHFQFNESPTSNVPWPGLDNVGYGTGQGLAGYGLGDQVVRRDHLGLLDPVTGTALEWYADSDSFEGNKAMIATPRGLLVGGDGMWTNGVRTGRVAFFDLTQLPAATATDTTITAPIEGRVVQAGQSFTVTGTAKATGGIRRVQVELQDRDTKRYLQDDGVTWSTTANNFYATLGAGGTTTSPRGWTQAFTVTGNRKLLVTAKTYGVNGTNDATKATKKIESFGTEDQTPSTSINGPSGIQTSTSFTVTGSASDDKGVDRLTYWFRDAGSNYLQDDGSVSQIYNTFSGTPDVIGATSATWSYDVTLPHEGDWRGGATAYDTIGQADLRDATRDWTVNSNAVAPTITVNAPVAMTPPFSVPSFNVNPGSPITFSGTATDDIRLKDVEITLRNSSTRENLAADGTWSVTVGSGQHRISPVNINAASYNWSYTTPFNLSPGSYSFTVRATDTDGITTSSTNQGRLSFVAQIPGDVAPNGLITAASSTPVGTVTSPNISLVGTATDDKGVESVKLVVQDQDTGRYLQNNGTYNSTYNQVTTTLGSPNATSTGWTYNMVLPGSGDYSVTAFAYDTVGQQDPSTSGATARYRYYPGDLPPTFNTTLMSPATGATFTEGRIVANGRAEDDISMAQVGVGIINAAGQYMSSSGTFTSTTPSYRTAFLNSPGSPGSNFSYTSPVIPAGTYSVEFRAVDSRDQVGPVPLPRSTGIVVTSPPNNAPVANATVSCAQNVCSFDGRSSTDENAATLTYAWTFGTGQGSGSGSVPTKTYTTPGTYTPTLTVKDEWNVTSAVFTMPPITITEPAGNQAPTVAFATNCIALACATSSAGTVDPNTGDTISYLWNGGDGTATSTGSAPSHTYALQGTYTVTLTVTDGWGKATTVTKNVTMTEPANNAAPTVAWTQTCSPPVAPAVTVVCSFNSTGTADPNGDQIRYSWNFGDATTSTSASPSKTFATAGTYTVVLTVTDGWNKVGTLSKTITVP